MLDADRVVKRLLIKEVMVVTVKACRKIRREEMVAIISVAS